MEKRRDYENKMCERSRRLEKRGKASDLGVGGEMTIEECWGRKSLLSQTLACRSYSLKEAAQNCFSAWMLLRH